MYNWFAKLLSYKSPTGNVELLETQTALPEQLYPLKYSPVHLGTL